MKLDAQLGGCALADVPDAAQRLERIGYDCLWSVETNGDPFMPLALAAPARHSACGPPSTFAFPRCVVVPIPSRNLAAMHEHWSSATSHGVCPSD